MKKSSSKKGAVHRMPVDLRKSINSSPQVKTAWGNITPLARNEFICWVLEAKQKETREKRIQRTCEDIMNGKRRPCCWAGCPHR